MASSDRHTDGLAGDADAGGTGNPCEAACPCGFCRRQREIERLEGEWTTLNNARMDEKSRAYDIHAALFALWDSLTPVERRYTPQAVCLAVAEALASISDNPLARQGHSDPSSSGGSDSTERDVSKQESPPVFVHPLDQERVKGEGQ